MGSLVFSRNKTDHPDIAEIMLKVELSTTTLPTIMYETMFNLYRILHIPECVKQNYITVE